MKIGLILLFMAFSLFADNRLRLQGVVYEQLGLRENTNGTTFYGNTAGQYFISLKSGRGPASIKKEIRLIKQGESLHLPKNFRGVVVITAP